MKMPNGFIYSTWEVVAQIEDRQQAFSKTLGLLDGTPTIPQDPKEREEYLIVLDNYIFLNKCIAEWAEIHKDWLEMATKIRR